VELDNAFTVSAPIDQVWTTLMEFDRVARCVPGAEVLQQLSDDVYQVAMRVKLGPVTMQYRGQLEVIERDEEGRRAVLRGKAKEARGQGNAEATAQLQLSQDGELVRGAVHADVRLLGRAAAMGQGVIASVADQILGQFAKNLQTMLNQSEKEPTMQSAAQPDGIGEPADADRSGETVAEGVDTAAAGSEHAGVIAPPEGMSPKSSPVEQTRGDAAMTEGQVVTGPGEPGGSRVEVPSGRPSAAPVSGGAQSMPGARISDQVSASDRPPSTTSGGSARGGGDAGGSDDAGSLDVLGLGRGMLAGQLRRPGVAVGACVTGLLAAFWLGRRSGRRSRSAAGTFSVDDLERLLDLLENRRFG
jgi:uncharacterized protein